MKKDRLHLLYQYITSSNEWHSAEELAAHLHTTTRTVRNYIQEINGKGSGNVLILASHKGYRWNQESHYHEPSVDIGKSGIPDTPNGRYWYIIRKIIVEQIEIDALINDLVISDRTIDADIQKVREIAKSYHIKLRKRKNHLLFAGKKSDIRLLSFLCILNTTGHEILSYDFIVRAFPEYDCAGICRILNETLYESHLNPNAYYQYDLLLLIMLQYRDISLGNTILSPECPVPGLQNYYDFTVACKLADKFFALFGLKYNLWEREYLAALLISKTEAPDAANYALIPNYAELKALTISYLEMAGGALYTNLLEDHFISYLTGYFQRLLVRQAMRLGSQDLVFHSLKTSHPVIQDVSAWILLFLSKQYNLHIDRNEVGFLTKVLCDFVRDRDYPFEMSVNCTLICPSFGHFPDSLIHTLEQRLADAVHIHTVISNLDIDRIEDSLELYISVIPLQNIRHLVNISLYPRSADFRHIYTEIHRIKMKLYCERLAENLCGLLTEDTFVCSPHFTSGKDAFQHMCAQLVSLGYTNEDFEKRILEREAIDSSTFRGNIVLPHTSDESIFRDFAYVVLSKVPIPWEQSRVNLICMIGTQKNHIREMHTSYDLAIKVFSYYRNVNAVLNAHDLNSFLDILKTIDLV